MVRKLRRQAIAFCFVALAPWAAAQAQNVSSGAGCHLDTEAKLPLTDIGKHYAVPVGFNGETRLFIVDTGSDKTLLSADAADALQLPRNIAHTEQVNGLGESAEHDYPRIVDSLKLGPVEWTRLVTPTAKMSFPAQGTKASVIGILGNDVLSRFDVELDFPAKTMTLYSARNCRGRFAPWSSDYQAYSAEYTSRHRFILTLGLDRHRMRALLDTGAESTVVSRKAALDAGADITANDPASSGRAINGKPLDVRVHQFREMTVGDRTFGNARVGVIDTPMSTDMLLGMDFLQWRRIWLSYSTGWVFMQLGSARSEIGAVAAKPEPSPSVPLYMPGQLAAISKDDAASDALPADRLRAFSTHSHITYQVMPRVVEVPRLSPEAHAPASFVPIH